LLINCGYPLIERFPLMLGTAGGVLLIGLVRWYFGVSQRATAAADSSHDSAGSSVVGAIAGKLNSLLGFTSREGDPDDAPAAGAKRTSPKGDSRTERAARGGRSAGRTSRTHARRARPPLEDDPGDGQQRRRRAAPRDFDPADPPPRPRRRPRPQGDPDLRQTPRDTRARRHPYDRPYEGPPPRGSRFDSHDPPYEPRRRRAGANGSGTTHHPISQVRYRGSGPLNEPRSEPRSRSRAPRSFPAESWEYEG
jgi:hypothetical protein